MTKGDKVKQIQKALAALYFYLDKSAKTLELMAIAEQRQQMQSNGSSQCTGRRLMGFTDRKQK
ncbi:hypothetical protein BAT02nite_00400 [Bacillus atrophaeus]|nr:hypothetical protein BAT02nite_00400 [Bacillus atrophaeus]